MAGHIYQAHLVGRHTLLVDPYVASCVAVDLLDVGASVSNDAADDLGRNFGGLLDEMRLPIHTGDPNLLRGVIEVALVGKKAAPGPITTGPLGMLGISSRHIR